MKRLLLVCCIAPLSLFLICSQAFGYMEQKLRLKLDPEAHLLEVSALLSAGTETTLPQSYRLAAHAEIDGVWADGAVAAYAFADGVLRLKQAPAATLKLRYVARFDDAPPQQIVGIEDPSYGVSATIMPQGSYLSAGAEWHPRAQGLNSLFQVQIVGPPGMAGVTSGRLLEHVDGEAETVTRWQTQLPQAALALAAGPFQIEQQELDGIQLLTFLRSENAALANGYLQSTKEYLQLYQELFGPYPYGKFAVVENFYPTGYGLPGWTLLGSRVIRLPFIRTTSLPHEIAHAWWGNAIEVDYGAGNWGEGLATYVADYLLKERADVSEALEYRRKLLRDYAALVAPGDDFPLVDFRSRASRSEQAVGYGKAAFVFHMLRQLIGDEAFWAGLKQAATQGKGKTYRWDDLQRHFQSVTEVELTDFFAQWLQRSGAPRLSLSDVTALETEAGWQVSGTLRQEQKGKAYGLAVPLQLKTETRSYTQVAGLAQQEDCFVFTVADKPLSLSVDPHNHLFRQLYPEELPATVNHLRASKSPLVVVATGAEALLEASNDLLRGLQWHQAEVVSEAEYLKTTPETVDLLIIGQPQHQGLLPDLPHSDAIVDRLPSAADEVVFWVRKQDSSKQVIAAFLPGSVAAARDTARRIPHYGRYSYLLFEKGRNLHKSTWDTVASPLIETF